MGNCNSNVRSAPDTFAVINRELDARGPAWFAGTEFGQRVARVLKTGDFPHGGSYLACARALLLLFDDDRDGMLAPADASALVSALTQVFFSFEHCKSLVGEDITPQEREVAEAEMTQELLELLLCSGEESIGVGHLSVWLQRIEEANLFVIPATVTRPAALATSAHRLPAASTKIVGHTAR